jgi:hypothetical protein
MVMIRTGELISAQLGYRAMVIFMDRYYDRGGGADSLADVMSSISTFLWGDGTPNDPAMWSDWLDAIDSARKELDSPRED